MSIREQAAALAESYGPTGVQIAHQIRALSDPRSVTCLRSLLIDARNMIELRRTQSAGGHARPEEDLLFRLDAAIFGHSNMPSPPDPERAPGHTDLMITPEAIDLHLAGITHHLGTRTRDMRQATVESWVRRAFGDETMLRPDERAARVLEEATELAQACGVPEATAEKIRAYVYARPVGDPAQEVGGVGLTLLACCGTLGISADKAESDEVARVLAKPLEHWNRRWQEKSKAGITPGIHKDDRAPFVIPYERTEA